MPCRRAPSGLLGTPLGLLARSLACLLVCWLARSGRRIAILVIIVVAACNGGNPTSLREYLTLASLLPPCSSSSPSFLPFFHPRALSRVRSRGRVHDAVPLSRRFLVSLLCNVTTPLRYCFNSRTPVVVLGSLIRTSRARPNSRGRVLLPPANDGGLHTRATPAIASRCRDTVV